MNKRIKTSEPYANESETLNEYGYLFLADGYNFRIFFSFVYQLMK